MKKITTIDAAIESKFANDKQRMLANMVYTANWLQRQFESLTKPFGISMQQYNILRILRGAGDWINMNTMRERMLEKSPNATRLCDKLVTKELIERKRSEEDRRVVYLKIKQKGLDILNDIDKKDKGSIDKLFENFTDEEAKTVSSILDKLRAE